jgi:hypothetical protein
MKRYVAESWVLLLIFEFLMHFRSFRTIDKFTRNQKTRTIGRNDRPSSELLCRAMDCACVLYFKHVLCLQRSGATTLLLRRYGWKAEMVLGARMLFFQRHAWVEIEGSVVNDKPYMRDLYRVYEQR